MKKNTTSLIRSYRVILVIITLLVNVSYAGKTLIIPRSVSTDATPELSLSYFQDIHNIKPDTFTWSLDVIPFFQASAQPDQLARYLLPYCSTYLNVREDGLGNVGSPWLYLVAQPGSRFNSTLCIKPRFEKTGVMFGARFNFDNIHRGLWLSLIFTPLCAINKLNMCENQIGAQGGVAGYRSIAQALNNYGMQYWCDKTKKAGIDDMQIKLGYRFKPIRDRFTIDGYLVGVLPTSPREKAFYFFEPLVGNGGHGGLGVGLCGCADIRKNQTTNWSWLFDAKWLFFFKRTQCRAFDLINGDWSRYLLCAFQEVPQVGFPLLPLLVRNVQITPGNQLSLWQAFHCQHHHWHGELGACFWYRGQDRYLCVNNVSFGTLGIYDLLGMRDEDATSASTARIDQTSGGQNSVASDTIFKKLSAYDINCCSAQQSNAYTFKLFGSVGYEVTSREYPLVFGLTGFYEFSNRCTALNQCGILLKGCFNF